MTDYDFGDVLLVPFPFTDHTTTKKRPAVVVSSTTYSKERPDVVLIAITSAKVSHAYFGDTPVQSWKEAGLLKPSTMKAIFSTLDKRLVYRKLGKLASGDKAALQEMLLISLGEG
ncbi:MAG: type II toxin-antitoxin system PemK/MazF family toxin [Nitrospirota bacterium]